MFGTITFEGYLERLGEDGRAELVCEATTEWDELVGHLIPFGDFIREYAYQKWIAHARLN